MRNIKTFFILICFALSTQFYAQQARIKGLVLDENKNPVSNVVVLNGGDSVETNENGFYIFRVNSKAELLITFMRIGYKTVVLPIRLKPNEDFELNIELTSTSEILDTIVVQSNPNIEKGVTIIPPEILRKIPGANAGVENILKTLPGVYSNNELSTQYVVRGGNYDENLVYVNEIEVYKPFLIRSGQQEGLSFINTEMVDKIDFSAGGFQAKYGDKMSSVLDITYRIPKRFKSSLEASFLGVATTVDMISNNQKWSNISGIRYRNNQLLVNSQETETNFSPTFLDYQTIVNYIPSTRWHWSFLGNISHNRYHYQPLSRQTNFGTMNDPKTLFVYYSGQEKDDYLTLFGAFKSVYKYSEDTKLKFIVSGYQSKEKEHFDIQAEYLLKELETDIQPEIQDDVKYSRGIGSQLNHARNDYDALILNTELKGFHSLDQHQLEWGIKYTRDDIKDRLLEWERVDSAGFSLAPPIFNIKKDEPYQVYEGPLMPYQNMHAINKLSVNRFSGYAQWSLRTQIENTEVWLNAGIRGHIWQVNSSEQKSNIFTIISPRAQISIKPDWNLDMIFRFSGGFYSQPPSYREMRAMDGSINFDLKAQKSINLVLGHDYSFKLWSQSFKLLTEFYYKNLSDVNTYTLENVRIRYQADNLAKAYVYGADIRLNAEIVPGTESWLSFGYLKSEENYNDKGYISRPTDQRLKFGVMFQDYMPRIPNLKMYLNMVYNTGLPGGSPSYVDPYIYQSRLKDYYRGDIGFSYVFKDAKIGSEKKWLRNFTELVLGFEIYNLYNNENSITNIWVRDVYSKTQYAIPNYMTMRTFNIKLNMRL